MHTILNTDPIGSGIELAAEHLRQGDPVALPTETVYGLAADALRAEAVLKIFEAKERLFFKLKSRFLSSLAISL